MKVNLSKPVIKQLNKLPELVRRKCIYKIRELVGLYTDHLNIRKLSNREGYRLRVGDYRVIYQLDKLKDELVVMSVGHRRDVYE